MAGGSTCGNRVYGRLTAAYSRPKQMARREGGKACTCNLHRRIGQKRLSPFRFIKSAWVSVRSGSGYNAVRKNPFVRFHCRMFVCGFGRVMKIEFWHIGFCPLWNFRCFEKILTLSIRMSKLGRNNNGIVVIFQMTTSIKYITHIFYNKNIFLWMLLHNLFDTFLLFCEFQLFKVMSCIIKYPLVLTMSCALKGLSVTY